MQNVAHLVLPRVLVLFICGGAGPCPLPEKSYIHVLVEEPLPGETETLSRVELRWPETGETFATFTCSEGPGPRSGLRWFYCWCSRRALEAVEWPWFSLIVDMDLCGDLEEAGPGGESPSSPIVLEGPEGAGLVAVDCVAQSEGGKVCVAGVSEDGSKAYGSSTCYVGRLVAFLPAHRGLRWAVYGDGGVFCRYYRCPASAGDYPLPVKVVYVFYKPNVEFETEVDGLLYVVSVVPPSGPVDVLGGCLSLF